MDTWPENIALSVVLVFLLGNGLTVASSDGQQSCEKPEYPPNTEVLLDSYQYDSLLSASVNQTDNDTKAVWYVVERPCQASAIAACKEGLMLQTQDIKPCTSANTNPVRVLVNMTVNCSPCKRSQCVSSLELQLVLYDMNQYPYYDGTSILPSTVPVNGTIVTHHAYFDLDVREKRFAFAVISRNCNDCIILRRLVIYRHNNFQVLGTVSPLREIYGVMEEHVKACFVSSNSGNVTVEVETYDGTAIGNFDYALVNATLSFKHEQPVCVDIEIASDGLTEADETFTIVLTKGCAILSSVDFIIYNNTGGSLSSCTEGSVSVVRDISNGSYKLVEMCSSEGVWVTACDHNWTEQDANVICRELDYAGLDKMNILEGSSHQSNIVPDCSGDENSIRNCLSSNHFNATGYPLLVMCKENQTSDAAITPSTYSQVTAVSSLPTHVLIVDGGDDINTALIVVVVVVIILLVFVFVLALLLGIKHYKNITCWNIKQSEVERNPVYEAQAHLTSTATTGISSVNEGTVEDSSDDALMQDNPLYRLQAQQKTHRVQEGSTVSQQALSDSELKDSKDSLYEVIT